MTKTNKRVAGSKHSDEQAKKLKVDASCHTTYSGFVPSIDNEKIDEIDIENIQPQQFYEQYVKARKPVLINGIIPEIDVDSLKSDKIVESLKQNNGDHFRLQVEHKEQGGFGSGSKRLHMFFDDFIKALKNGDTSKYLTTQYDESDVEDESDIEDDLDQEKDEDSKSGESDVEPELPKELNKSEHDGNEDIKGSTAIPKQDSLQNEADEDSGSGNDDDNNSDNLSIDMNDLHDDFDELNSDFKILATINGEELYLDEAIDRVYDLVQKPLTTLIAKRKLKVIPGILQTLIPQQINIWIGRSNNEEKAEALNLTINEDAKYIGLGRKVPGNGTSSGLHHDHADNLYIPVQGKKRFTIFAPSDAFNLYTVGDVHKVYDSGVIDYESNEKAPTWKHVRSDGATIQGSEESSSEDQSDDQEEDEGEEEDNKEEKQKLDPPSFSKVPPVLLHKDELNESNAKLVQEITNKHFPNLAKAKSITVNIRPNQMLYLPTGWFHEVTSTTDKDTSPDNIHIAVNYWFYPPDGKSFEKPYLDQYWKNDFQRTKKSYELYEAGEFDISDD